jgi:hypothetical protein
MTSADLLPAAVLKRKAVVYVRQSTQAQVQTNLESQRRQYELVDVARRRGFREVEVIDDGSGANGAIRSTMLAAEWLRVGNGQAEERGGTVRGSPLRPRSHHPVRALVSSIQAEPARPGGDDGRARPVDDAGFATLANGFRLRIRRYFPVVEDNINCEQCHRYNQYESYSGSSKPESDVGVDDSAGGYDPLSQGLRNR